MRSVLFLGLLSCITVACATATDAPDDGTWGGGSTGGANPGTGGDAGPSTGGFDGSTGGLGQGGAATGGTMSTGGDTATGGAASGGAPSGGTGGSGGGTMLECEDAVPWVAEQHSVNYPPGQLFTYEGGVYRYDGDVPMTYVNGDCPPDRSGAAWCQGGQYPYSDVTDC